MPESGHQEFVTDAASSRLAPLITVVVPVYNEEANVERAYATIAEVFAGLGDRYRLEVLFADNHSGDRTFALVKTLAARDPRVRALRYNRNYGFQRSLLTAYQHARGEAAIQIDCDLQDPPGLIPAFLALWEQGHDMVVGLRAKRQENAVLSATRRLYYQMLSRISEDKLIVDAGDFRLVDRSLLDQLDLVRDHHPYVRGILSSIACREATIAYERDVRRGGRSNFPLPRLVGFALDGIFSHSVLPLRIMAYFGLLLSILSFIVALGYLVASLAFGQMWPSGFATTTLLILLGIGINGIFLGIIGEYVGRIYQQVRQRPITTISDRINFEERQGEP